ncbi:RusA family crossover junction endodeoxyribonuclease [Streptococcus anginosus]|uniref:RusA family crossover junction endodeoxyribonuclease n=1 Tax=Streptococcus anginosus TaxID=1328 RepID=UPI0030CA56A3
MKLTLNIEPKPQSRPRFARRWNSTTTYEDESMKEWRRRCSNLIAEECLLDKLKEGTISLTATFYIKPPQYISKVKRNEQSLFEESIWTTT